jgi:hypothetical protein
MQDGGGENMPLGRIKILKDENAMARTKALQFF